MPLDPRWQAFWDVERWSLLWLEPPDHTRIRKLVAAAFTPRSVEAMREPAARLARELLDPLVERGHMDLLYDFAQPYSIGLICDWLGVPVRRPARAPRLVALDGEDVRVRNVRRAGRPRRTPRRRRSATSCSTSSPSGAWRHAPTSCPALLEARVDGEHLSDAEIVSTVIVLLNAGHEATVNTLGNGVLALMRHGDQWQRLLDGVGDGGNSRSRSSFATTRRCSSSSGGCSRTGSRWAVCRSPRGERISVLFGAANRDPRVFESPDAFDVGRPNAAEHISFGGGIHVCIGAPLARIELEASLRALVERCPRLELAAEPRRTPAFVIWGLEALELATS